MSKYAGENTSVTFILLVIDIFSKYIWLQPLQNKSGAETTKAFKAILKNGRTPTRLRTDKGKTKQNKKYTYKYIHILTFELKMILNCLF